MKGIQTWPLFHRRTYWSAPKPLPSVVHPEPIKRHKPHEGYLRTGGILTLELPFQYLRVFDASSFLGALRLRLRGFPPRNLCKRDERCLLTRELSYPLPRQASFRLPYSKARHQYPLAKRGHGIAVAPSQSEQPVLLHPNCYHATFVPLSDHEHPLVLPQLPHL